MLRRIFIAIALIAGTLGPASDVASQSREPQAHFLPEAGNGPILQLLREARSSVDLAAYLITDYEIAEALASIERRGVRVRVVLDEDQAMRNKYSQFSMLAKGGVRDVRLMPREAGIMVNDFGIIDRRFLYTGSSFLHTSVKESSKFANYLILPDARLVARYQQEFERLFERSKPR